eukprot:tig00000241_g20940.t1
MSCPWAVIARLSPLFVGLLPVAGTMAKQNPKAAAAVGTLAVGAIGFGMYYQYTDFQVSAQRRAAQREELGVVDSAPAQP